MKAAKTAINFYDSITVMMQQCRHIYFDDANIASFNPNWASYLQLCSAGKLVINFELWNLYCTREKTKDQRKRGIRF